MASLWSFWFDSGNDIQGSRRLYTASMQTVGSCFIHLESKIFILCSPHRKSIQHVNTTSHCKTVAATRGTPKKIMRLPSVNSLHSALGILPTAISAPGLRAFAVWAIASWRRCDHSSSSPWMYHSRHWRHSVYLHRSHARWNSRAPVHHQSPDSAAPSCAPSVATPQDCGQSWWQSFPIPHSTISFRQSRICPFGVGAPY